MWKRYLLYCYICSMSCLNSQAQTDVNQSWTIRPKLLTNGWQMGLKYSFKNSKEIYISIGEIKHEKEIKQQALPAFDKYSLKNKNFVLGKINNAYTFKIGMPLCRYDLFPFQINKQKIMFESQIGLQLLLLKPIYLNLVYYTPLDTNINETISQEKFNTVNKEIFTDRYSIAGRDKWTKGMEEMHVNPGLFLDAKLKLKTIDTKFFNVYVGFGGAIDVLWKRYYIMAGMQERRWMLSGFILMDLSLKSYK